MAKYYNDKSSIKPNSVQFALVLTSQDSDGQ